MKIQFRAKAIHEDRYVIGYFVEHPDDGSMILETFKNENKVYTSRAIKTRCVKIDKSTLSINFENMIDKNGKKIFASLSEDGVGGSKCTDSYNENYLCMFSKITNSCVMAYYTTQLSAETMGVYDKYWATFEIIGIKENK